MCDFCERGKPLAIGNTNDYGIAIQYPNKIIAFGYDVHGSGSNGLVSKINYCPICGRKLFDKTEKPIEDFLKSEIERSESRINVYAECFDGVHVDNETRKKLLENHIGFCKDALKQCDIEGKEDIDNSVECSTLEDEPVIVAKNEADKKALKDCFVCR